MSSQNPAPRPFSRPAYPTLQSHSASSSTNSSAYQSYSSTSSLSSPSPASAPLPSPSAQHAQQQGFFGSLNPQQQQQNQQSQQQYQQYHHASQAPQRQMSYEYRPNRDGAGRTASETNNYLSDYALVAEAAKRAQMAVLMRDVEGMEL